MEKYKEEFIKLDIREHRYFVTSLIGQKSGSAFVVMPHYKGDVMFHSTPCNFGGVRYWFVCHDCQSKRMVLRLVQNRLVCNGCINLPFKSASITKRKRAALKRVKILKKLGYGHEIDLVVLPDDEKPKGMWQKTYDKLRADYHQLLKQDALRMNNSCAAIGCEPFYESEDLAELYS